LVGARNRSKEFKRFDGDLAQAPSQATQEEQQFGQKTEMLFCLIQAVCYNLHDSISCDQWL
jgi:hypothetical protein